MVQLAYQDDIALGTDKAKEVLFKALFRIQENWGFTNQKMSELLHVKPNTYGNWMQSGRVPIGRKPFSPEVELVIAVVAIFRSLGAMFDSYHNQVQWLDSPHPNFQNQSPFEFAKQSCANVFWLRQYLDYKRGRGA